MSVLDEIVAERQSQVAKGYDAHHDREHESKEMADAAGVYALIGDRPSVSKLWPWAAKYLKPRSHRENCIRAAALLVAEIERLDAAQEGPQS